MKRLEIVPVTFRQAAAFVDEHHRHHGAARGWRFGVGIQDECGNLRGVAMAGRPISRALDDGRSIEVNRTCTDGVANGNSMLYGAVWRAAKALGYRRAYTYTQEHESGASLRAAGWIVDEILPPRGNWAESSVRLRAIRDGGSTAGGIGRIRWRIGQPRAERQALEAS